MRDDDVQQAIGAGRGPTPSLAKDSSKAHHPYARQFQ
jgi:hypothetical protein